MKTIILTLSVLALSLTTLGQNKTKIITLTEIYVENFETGSAFISYKDSQGVERSDMRFENFDVFIDGVIMFGYDGFHLVYFNKEYAEKILKQKPRVLMTYYEKEIKYFGTVPFVVSLAIIQETKK